eukprot:6182082-Pleurochrysis_carterae.AAC.1
MHARAHARPHPREKGKEGGRDVRKESGVRARDRSHTRTVPYVLFHTPTRKGMHAYRHACARARSHAQTREHARTR